MFCGYFYYYYYYCFQKFEELDNNTTGTLISKLVFIFVPKFIFQVTYAIIFAAFTGC